MNEMKDIKQTEQRKKTEKKDSQNIKVSNKKCKILKIIK